MENNNSKQNIEFEELEKKSNDPEKLFDRYNTELSKKSTNLIAAKVLANSNFPLEETLPRFYPTPFNNFGHYFLFDYERLLWILWDTIETIKSKINFWQKWLPTITMLATAILILTGIAFNGIENNIFAFLFFILLIVPLISFFIVKNHLETNFRKSVANLRAQTIKDLINDSWQPRNTSIPHKLEENLKLVGKSDIKSSKTPVIIFFNENHPFPGYGQLQFDQQFICIPKNQQPDKHNTAYLLQEKVTNDLKVNLLASEISNYRIGEIISVPSKSLDIDSYWLNENKTPRLNVEFDQNKLSPNDSDNSRSFIVVQVISPKHFIGITFFIRISKAENAATAHISVATLGPPMYGLRYLTKKLNKHTIENDKLKFKQNKAFVKDQLTRELLHQESLGQDNWVFSKTLPFNKISNLDLLSIKSNKGSQYSSETFRLIQESVDWPGRYYYPLNFREENSLTFPSDYFGRNESKCSVATLYDQISRSILDSFEVEGFDISNYKDKEGNYTISAEKIDNLIVGENINLGNTKGETKKSENNQKSNTTEE